MCDRCAEDKDMDYMDEVYESGDSTLLTACKTDDGSRTSVSEV